ncbi:unnamed protein product [Candida verbasci]|uniref:J domain-containing protein n=1 Tax=Candida verbasci TaxID=1227364 RepID=A0A9W4TXT3_9ASCO|nr:unnamed protein product [Candida verbasci]
MDDIINQLIKDNINIYEFLQVDPSSITNDIKKSYYKLSLKYHPDKKTGSIEQFNLLRTSYEILSNEEYKRKYDDLIKIKLQNQTNFNNLSETTRKFQTDILNQNKKKRSSPQNLELLREDGLNKRRKLEKSKNEKQTLSIYDLSVDFIIFFENKKQYLVKLKVKIKPKVEIDHIIITEIMSIFGEIKQVRFDSKDDDDRYEYFIIEFKNKSSMDSALNYDYSSGKKWDGTNVRKLASLLRRCNIVSSSTSYTNNSFVNSVLENYVKSVSDKISTK